jgi:hypothetical protein
LLEFFQFGYVFVRNSNTVCALFDLIARVQSSLDSRFRTSGLFLDLAKAFDVVDHEFLLTKGMIQLIGLEAIWQKDFNLCF